MNHIAFAVADNPFFKIDQEKYYPVAVVLNQDGEIVTQISPSNPESANFQNLRFRKGFRDERMRINDDKKIELSLPELEGHQVIFLVRSNDLRSEGELPENLYQQAWFRVQNEATSQTISYSKLAKVATPEDYVEFGEAEEDSAEAATRNELIFIAGRVF